MIGEVSLSKNYANDPQTYITSDVNEASRRFFLSRIVSVVPALVNVSALNTESEIFELPGRNNFVVDIRTVSGTVSALGVTLQGSLLGGAGTWANIGSEIATTNSISSFSDNRPFRYYRLVVTTGVTGGGKITAYFSAVGY
jgi:hypothetical protein